MSCIQAALQWNLGSGLSHVGKHHSHLKTVLHNLLTRLGHTLPGDHAQRFSNMHELTQMIFNNVVSCTKVLSKQLQYYRSNVITKLSFLSLHAAVYKKIRKYESLRWNFYISSYTTAMYTEQQTATLNIVWILVHNRQLSSKNSFDNTFHINNNGISEIRV